MITDITSTALQTLLTSGDIESLVSSLKSIASDMKAIRHDLTAASREALILDAIKREFLHTKKTIWGGHEILSKILGLESEITRGQF